MNTAAVCLILGFLVGRGFNAPKKAKPLTLDERKTSVIQLRVYDIESHLVLTNFDVISKKPIQIDFASSGVTWAGDNDRTNRIFIGVKSFDTNLVTQ